MSNVVSAVNKARRERGSKKEEGGKKPSSRAVREVRIRPAQGGHVVSTEYEPDGDEMYCPPEDHVFTDHQAMLDHVSKHTK